MDALTNVIAVLILVLLLVQADVTQKVQKFFDDLPPATPEQIAESKARIIELERKQTVANARLMEKPPSPQEIAAVESEITKLQASISEINKDKKELSNAQELLKQVQANLDQEATKTDALTKQLQEIDVEINALPAIDPDTPTVVNIPNSRPIPDNAKKFTAMIIKDRIHIIDPHTIIDTFNREFDRRKNDWVAHRVKIKGKPDKIQYDGVKIANHFKTFNWGNTRNQTIEIIARPTDWNLSLVIRPDLEKGGTPIASIDEANSEFVSASRFVARGFSSVLMYNVHPDCFTTYLAARERTEKLNIAAGWDISYRTDFSMYIPEVTIKRLQEPPKGNPTGPARPPGVKPKLD